MLKARSLEAGYGDLKVLKGVSLHVLPGEIVAIIGANGAGKSTLLGTLAGLLRPKAGSIILKGEEIAGARPESILGRGCSLVPEGRKLFAPLTVLENLELGGYSIRRRYGGTTGQAGIGGRPRDRLRALPAAEGEAAPARRHPLRRRAADARDRPLPHVSARARHARRAFDGPRAPGDPRHLRGHSRP